MDFMQFFLNIGSLEIFFRKYLLFLEKAGIHTVIAYNARNLES